MYCSLLKLVNITYEYEYMNCIFLYFFSPQVQVRQVHLGKGPTFQFHLYSECNLVPAQFVTKSLLGTAMTKHILETLTAECD